MSNKIIIKIINESIAVVISQDSEIHAELNKKFSFYKKGYKFHKLYKLGRWDGKIGFYSQNGKTYFNLLNEIIQYFKSNNYEYIIADNRDKFIFHRNLINEKYFENVTLAQHQIDAVNSIIKNDGGIVIAATGAGKTFITAALSDYYNKNYEFRVLMIVPSTDLILQSHAAFIECGIPESKLGLFYGEQKDMNSDILISTWQSLQNSPHLVSQFKVIIVDECHGTTANVLKDLIINHGANAPIKIGVTGTLPKDELDLMSVKVSLGEVKYTVEPSVLINLGWLSTIKINGIILEETFEKEYKEYVANFLINYPPGTKQLTYKQFIKSIFPDYFIEKKYISNNDDRLDYIAEIINYNMEKSTYNNTLVLVDNISTGNKLQKKIKDSIFIKQENKNTERKEIYKSFQDNDNICVIATYKLASTGLDVKRIYNLFIIDSGQSFIKVIQSLGRGLRKTHNKNSLKVFDISSNLPYSKAHRQVRKKYYNEKFFPYTEHSIKYKE